MGSRRARGGGDSGRVRGGCGLRVRLWIGGSDLQSWRGPLGRERHVLRLGAVAAAPALASREFRCGQEAGGVAGAGVDDSVAGEVGRV